MPLQSSQYLVADENSLQSPLNPLTKFLSPGNELEPIEQLGKSGPANASILYRIWFSFEIDGNYDLTMSTDDFVAAADATVSSLGVENTTSLFFVGKALYRLDIMGKRGDKINFKSTATLTGVRFFRVQAILIGT